MLDTEDDVTQTTRGEHGRAQTLQPIRLTQWLSGTPRLGQTRSRKRTDPQRSGKRSQTSGHKQTKRGRGTMATGTLHDYLLGTARPRQPKTPRRQEAGNRRWGSIDHDKSALAFRIAVENVNTLAPRHHNNSKLNTIRKFDRHYGVDVRCMSELNANWDVVQEENKLHLLLAIRSPDESEDRPQPTRTHWLATTRRNGDDRICHSSSEHRGHRLGSHGARKMDMDEFHQWRRTDTKDGDDISPAVWR